MSTNLESVFKLILSKGKSENVPQEQMPTMILILSDMEFNSATRSNWNPTAQEMIESMYLEAGYKMPKIVYWNLNSRNQNVPVKFDKQDTALVSGFSPSLLKSLLSGKDLTPLSMMYEVINSERYAAITV
jgi:hypothetical protein